MPGPMLRRELFWKRRIHVFDVKLKHVSEGKQKKLYGREQNFLEAVSRFSPVI